jgi:hypothetical protein
VTGERSLLEGLSVFAAAGIHQQDDFCVYLLRHTDIFLAGHLECMKEDICVGRLVRKQVPDLGAHSASRTAADPYFSAAAFANGVSKIL